MSGAVRKRRGCCVLVVDDEDDVRETLCEAVEMIGCTATGARNGADALGLLATERPCLVIVDLMMPVMTGEELLTLMRRDPSLSALDVVISTSAPHRAPQGVPVLPKPIDIDKLWSWMRRSCRCGRARAARLHDARA